MDPADPVLERMQKNETVSNGGGVNDGRDTSLYHLLVGGHQTFHQAGEVFGLRGREVHLLLLPGNGLADVILTGAIARGGEPRIDDAVLHLDLWETPLLSHPTVADDAFAVVPHTLGIYSCVLPAMPREAANWHWKTALSIGIAPLGPRRE
jgi:hypothetical protein